jgi:hypothetical protein
MPILPYYFAFRDRFESRVFAGVWLYWPVTRAAVAMRAVLPAHQPDLRKGSRGLLSNERLPAWPPGAEARDCENPAALMVSAALSCRDCGLLYRGAALPQRRDRALISRIVHRVRRVGARARQL